MAPGVIAHVILYGSKDGSDLLVAGDLVLACFVLALLVFVIVLSGRWLKSVIGSIGPNILTHVMGLMVAPALR